MVLSVGRYEGELGSRSAVNRRREGGCMCEKVYRETPWGKWLKIDELERTVNRDGFDLGIFNLLEF